MSVIVASDDGLVPELAARDIDEALLTPSGTSALSSRDASPRADSFDGEGGVSTPHQAWFQKLLAEPYETVYIEQSSPGLEPGEAEVCIGSDFDMIPEIDEEDEPEQDLMMCIRNLDTGEVRDLREDFDPDFFGKYQDPAALAKEKSLRPWNTWWTECRQRNEDLWRAAQTGSTKDVVGLLEAARGAGGVSAAVNSRALYGKTAIHMASSAGSADCVQALLHALADACATTDAGCTALHLACEHGHLEVVQLLHAAGCDMQAQTWLGESPLHLASSKGHTAVLRYLLDSCTGDHLAIKNNYGQVPSQVSRDMGTQALFEATSASIMEASHASSIGGDMMEDPYAGRTAFNGAVLRRNSRHDVVQRLLQRTGVEAGIGYSGSGDYERENGKPDESTSSSRPRGSQRCFSKPRADSIEVVGPDSFSLKTLLGKGSFGEVYKVQHRKTGEVYAMKVLRKSKIFSRNLVRYAVTERNLLSYIKHPFIVRLHYAFQTPTCLVLVLQYCPGGNLAALVAHEGRVAEPLGHLYISEIFLAIEYLHERKVVYRDMKPENVVLDQGSHAMLTDFGLSKEGVEGLQGTRSFCGSTAYLAPEVLAKAGHGPPVDLYGLGVLLHELLTGQPPYYSRDKKTLLRNIAEASLHIPHYVSAPAASFIQGMLHRNPAHRLGAQNTSDVRQHPFFDNTDWEAVLKRQVPVPLLSQARNRDLMGVPGEFGKVPSPFEGRLEAQVMRLGSNPQELSGWEFSTAPKPSPTNAQGGSQSPVEAMMGRAQTDNTARWSGRPRRPLQAPVFF
mmetsp:Transcript_48011/g.88389  ORF Transcript_48011/g.88389 Transcript_48011/m.88389 type:complete len:789 (-) Transcript_48011:16-2382(-)